MEIPSHLVDLVREGKVVPFLGAGASLDSTTECGTRCPGSKELGRILADKFLGGSFRDASLSQIAEYAISESDLGTVQQFIRATFLGLRPTAAHLLLPKFVWWGLATTNYDLLIETAYSETKSRVQDVRPMVEDTDRVDDQLRDKRNVLLLKLHGCINRIASDRCPLILTLDQYIGHREYRGRLFRTLEEWGEEHPLVFIGHSIQDSDNPGRSSRA